MQNILCLLNFLTKLVAKEEAQVKMESKVWDYVRDSIDTSFCVWIL